MLSQSTIDREIMRLQGLANIRDANTNVIKKTRVNLSDTSTDVRKGKFPFSHTHTALCWLHRFSSVNKNQGEESVKKAQTKHRNNN